MSRVNTARIRAQIRLLERALDAGYERTIIEPQLAAKRRELRDHYREVRRQHAEEVAS